MNMLEYELREAEAWRRGVDARRVAEGREPRKPFFMSAKKRAELEGKALIEKLKMDVAREEREARLAEAQAEFEAQMDTQYRSKNLRRC